MDYSDINCRYAQINGFEDYYITEHGDIYSVRKRGFEKTRRLRKLTPKDPGKRSKYLNIILCRDGEQKTFSIHRLVAEYFVAGKFDGAVVNHIDGNNRNNDVTNLEWVTPKANINKSYLTSGASSCRNFLIWELYRGNEFIDSFLGNIEMKKYIISNNIDTSVSSLVKYGQCGEYHVVKRKPSWKL